MSGFESGIGTVFIWVQTGPDPQPELREKEVWHSSG